MTSLVKTASEGSNLRRADKQRSCDNNRYFARHLALNNFFNLGNKMRRFDLLMEFFPCRKTDMMEFHFSLVSFCAIMKELIFTFSSRVIVVNYVKFDEVRIE